MRRFLFISAIVFILFYGCGGWDNPIDPNAEEPTPPPYDVLDLPEVQISNPLDTANQDNHSVAYGNGVYLVVWMDDRDNSGLDGEDIWGALLDENLKVIKEFPIFKKQGRDMNPTVAYDPVNNYFVVAWFSYAQYGLKASPIMVSIVDTTGVVLNVREIPLATQYASDVKIKIIGSNLFVLFKDTWATYDINIGGKVIKFAVLNPDLTTKNIYTLTDTHINGINVDPLEPSFDCSPNACLITWAMTKNIIQGGLHIYGRTLSLTTGELSDEIQFTYDPIGKKGTKTSPMVIWGNNSFLVTWKDWDSTQGYASVDLMGRFLYPDGNPGNTFLISDFSGLAGMVYSYAVAFNPFKNTFTSVWADVRGNPNSYLFARDIYGEVNNNRCARINNMYSHRNVNLTVGSKNLLVTWTESAVRESNGYFLSDIFGLLL